MKKQTMATSIGAALILSTISLPNDTSAKTSYMISHNKLVYKQTKKTVKGYVQYNKKMYKNGTLLTGTYKKKLYKSGTLFTGTKNKIMYVKGIKLTGKKNGIRYKNGVKLTGTYAKAFYKNGQLFTGSYKGIRYTGGQRFTGYIRDAYYRNGMLFAGKMDGTLYEAGRPFNGMKNTYLYANGTKLTGIDAVSSKAYKNGRLLTGASTWDNKQYKNGMLLNEQYDGKLYKDGLAVNGSVNGLYYVNGTIHTFAQTEDGTLYKEGKLFNGFYGGFVYTDGIKGAVATISSTDAAIQIATSQTDPTVYKENASYTFIFYDGVLFTGTYVASDGTETTIVNGLPKDGLGLNGYVYKEGNRYYPKTPEKINNRYYVKNHLYTGYFTLNEEEVYIENGQIQANHIKETAISSATQLDITLVKPFPAVQASDVVISQNGQQLPIKALTLSDDAKSLRVELSNPLSLGNVTMAVAGASTETKTFGHPQTKTFKRVVFDKAQGPAKIEPIIIDTNGIDVTAYYANRIHFEDSYRAIATDGTIDAPWLSNKTFMKASIINEAGDVLDTFSRSSTLLFYGTFHEQATDTRATIAKEVFVGEANEAAANPITTAAKNTTSDFVHVFKEENNVFKETKATFISMTPEVVSVNASTGQLTYKKPGHAKIAYTTSSSSDIYFYEFELTK